MNKGKCIHYNGVQNECCKAGVEYRTAFGPRPGVMLRMPCFLYDERPAHGRGTYIKPGEAVVRKEIDRRGEAMIPCDKFLEPTDAQVEQDRIETEAHSAKTLAAIKVASAWRVNGRPTQDRREVVECPICKSRLHLSQSAYNGHVHGRCETFGCVNWME